MTADNVTWLTQEAYDRLQAEFDERSSTRRAEITKRIEVAREEGDLRENGGYHAAREEQGKNEARIRQLKHTLEHARIGTPEVGDGEVHVGQVVTIALDDGERETFLLASREEASHASIDVISPTSPMGASLVGTHVGDRVTYALPNGREETIEVVSVVPYGG